MLQYCSGADEAAVRARMLMVRDSIVADSNQPEIVFSENHIVSLINYFYKML